MSKLLDTEYVDIELEDSKLKLIAELDLAEHAWPLVEKAIDAVDLPGTWDDALREQLKEMIKKAMKGE